jgi:HK97 gp10 family phage protein
MTATMRGEAAVRTKLASVMAKMAATAPVAEGAGAQMVARGMAAYAPVHDGDLLASIGVDGSSAVATAPHARFVQFGTRNMGAQPFMTDGARAVEGEVVAAVAAAMKAAIRTEV